MYEENLQYVYIFMFLYSSQLQNRVLLHGPSLNITNTANQLNSVSFL